MKTLKSATHKQKLSFEKILEGVQTETLYSFLVVDILRKQVLQIGVKFALNILRHKNAKEAAIDQAKAPGSNLLQMAKQKVGNRNAAPRKVKKKKYKKHHNIFA